jgi:hypothetical protein
MGRLIIFSVAMLMSVDKQLLSGQNNAVSIDIVDGYLRYHDRGDPSRTQHSHTGESLDLYFGT